MLPLQKYVRVGEGGGGFHKYTAVPFYKDTSVVSKCVPECVLRATVLGEYTGPDLGFSSLRNSNSASKLSSSDRGVRVKLT